MKNLESIALSVWGFKPDNCELGTSLNKRLAGPAQISNAAATKYTVPASTTTIVQHVHVYNPSAATVNFTMSIGADAAGTRLYDAYAISGGGFLDVFVKYTLTAAEIIQAFGSVNNILVLTIDGVEISPG
jgi:hypothetical protein